MKSTFIHLRHQPHSNKGYSEKLILFALRLTALGSVNLALLSGCQSSLNTAATRRPVAASATAAEAQNHAKIISAVMRRDTVLFGEVHYNPAQHALRANLVRQAILQGARPAMAFEQFDRDAQPRIDTIVATRPNSADDFLDALFPGNTRPKGWQWPLYAPLIELALQYELPIIAANLSRADAIKVSMSGLDAVFDSPTLTRIGLDRAVTAHVRTEQARAIKEGHCNALPDDGIAAMASAQIARDAVLAERLRAQQDRGVILFAGNGHTRRDVGVGYWLSGARPFTAIGLLERGDLTINASGRFDITLVTEPHRRDDPCIAFRARPLPTHTPKS